MSTETEQRQVVKLGRIEVSEEELELIVDGTELELCGHQGLVVGRNKYCFNLVSRIVDGAFVKVCEYLISRENRQVYLDPKKTTTSPRGLFGYFDYKLREAGK